VVLGFGFLGSILAAARSWKRVALIPCTIPRLGGKRCPLGLVVRVNIG
jgi:hypothetical protein